MGVCISSTEQSQTYEFKNVQVQQNPGQNEANYEFQATLKPLEGQCLISKLDGQPCGESPSDPNQQQPQVQVDEEASALKIQAAFRGNKAREETQRLKFAKQYNDTVNSAETSKILQANAKALRDFTCPEQFYYQDLTKSDENNVKFLHETQLASTEENPSDLVLIYFKEKNQIYYGQILNKQKHGVGALVNLSVQNQVYFGFWFQDEPYYGLQIIDLQQFYLGEWQNKKFHGEGLFTNQSVIQKGKFQYGIFIEGDCEESKYTSKFFGKVEQGKRQGYGRLELNECVYEGNFENDAPNGMGELRWNDGSYYKGEVKNGKMHGTGHFVDGNITYAGSYYDGLKSGYGTLIFDGKKYEGLFQQGKMNGEGTLTDIASNEKQAGIWENNILIEQS